MLNEWVHWFSGLHRNELLPYVAVMFLLDVPRFTLMGLTLCVWDGIAWLVERLRGTYLQSPYRHCPSACVIIAGYNEAATIGATLRSIHGTYPRLEIIVVDDGSQDGTADVARSFAQTHEGVVVLRKPRRGGKSSALNFGLAHTRAEIVIGVDADSHLEPTAIWEILQPFKDPRMGAVAGGILARNAFTNLITWCQAYEYRQGFFIERILYQRMGLLALAAGAFAAMRRDALEQLGGWDVGPSEDIDVTLQIRKAGYKIGFARHARCHTDVPTTLRSLVKQRQRWDEGGVVRHFCRKHLDLFYFWQRGHHASNLFMALEMLSMLPLVASRLAFVLWFCVHPPGDPGRLVFTVYAGLLLFEFYKALFLLFYAVSLRRDLATSLVFFLMPFYSLFLYAVAAVSHVRELFWRTSFRDNAVPEHVREVTWHW